MNKITRVLGLLAAGSVLIAGCGSPKDSAATASTSVAMGELATMPTTTTTADATRVAMVAWATAHSGDVGAIKAALDKLGAIAGQISTQAGDNIDNYTATHDVQQMIAGSAKIDALEAQSKQICLGIATATKKAQAGLPIPVESISEPYASALGHYLSASRACQVGDVSETTSEIAAGNTDVETASQAISDFTG